MCQVVMFATVFLLFMNSLSQANPNPDKVGQDVGTIAWQGNNLKADSPSTSPFNSDIRVEITAKHYVNPQFTPAVLHGTVTKNGVKLVNQQVLYKWIEGPRTGLAEAVFTYVTQPLGFINAPLIYNTDMIAKEQVVLQWRDSDTGVVYTSQPSIIETVSQPSPLPSIGCDNHNPNDDSNNSGSNCLQLVAFPNFKTRRLGDQTGFGAWIQDQNNFRNCGATIVFKIVEADDPNRVGTEFVATANQNIGCIAQVEFIVQTCGAEKVIAQYTDGLTGQNITSQPLSALTIGC